MTPATGGGGSGPGARALGGNRTSRESFLFGQGHFLGPPFGSAFARRPNGLGRDRVGPRGAAGPTGGIGRGRGGHRFVGLRDHGSSTCLHDCVFDHEARHLCVFPRTRARMPPAAPVCRPPHPSRAGWRAQTRRAAAEMLGCRHLCNLDIPSCCALGPFLRRTTSISLSRRPCCSMACRDPVQGPPGAD